MLCLLVAAALVASPIQRPWKVTENNTLLWNDRPYMPVGLRIDGTPEAILLARAAGAKDVIVDLPADGAGWGPALKALDEAGLRYLIAISSLAPTSTGIAVEPQGYRVPGIAAPRRVELDIPGATSALVSFVTQRDGAIQFTKRVELPSGKLSMDVDPQNELEHVLLVYPNAHDLRVPDYWSGFDKRRDEILATLKEHRPKGLRGIVNPMGTLLSFPGSETNFVPTNRLFRLELEAFLRFKYTSVQTAIRAWSLNINDLQSFTQLSRLVPLWSNTRGIPVLWDPDTDETVGCDSKKSAAWRDIQEVLRNTATRRYSRLVKAIQQVVDVPVLQEWTGWSGPYAAQESALTGVGMRMEGTSPASLVDSACRAAATVLRWTHPAWLVATDIQVDGVEKGEVLVADALTESASMGARGWFVRARTDEVRRAAISATIGSDESLTSWRTMALLYPESAMNPAAPTRLPGGRWWLPSPASGNRIDLGNSYAAYRYTDGLQSFVAIWSIGAARKTTLRVTDPKKLVFETIDGSQTGAKIVKNSIELTLPTTPVILRGSDEIPIPQDAIDETAAAIADLLDKKGGGSGLGEEQYRLADSLAAVERNPGGAFDALRQQLNRLNMAYGKYVWLEGEQCRETTFSEPLPVPGTSRNGALALKSRLASPPEGYFANYTPAARVEGVHEIWIAANIPPKHRSEVSLRIGDQVLKIQRGPVSLYAGGYGWYKMGDVSLVKGPIALQVAVDAREGADIALDAVVLIPDRFAPNGVYPPPAGL